MTLIRQSISSIAQVLGALTRDDAVLLLHKHLGVEGTSLVQTVSGYLEALRISDPAAIMGLARELVGEAAAIRTSAPIRHAFDAHIRTLCRWLLHDGWTVQDSRLVRLAPAAEEATGVRDALIEQLVSSGLDENGGIRKSIEDAAEAFVRESPDFNASITHVRIALESIARAAAKRRSTTGGLPYQKDSWGAAIAYLRQSGILEIQEEEILTRVYTFISPAAHVPTGITEEEWARLARTFGLGAAYFVLKKELGDSHSI